MFMGVFKKKDPTAALRALVAKEMEAGTFDDLIESIKPLDVESRKVVVGSLMEMMGLTDSIEKWAEADAMLIINLEDMIAFFGRVIFVMEEVPGVLAKETVDLMNERCAMLETNLTAGTKMAIKNCPYVEELVEEIREHLGHKRG